MKTDPGGREAKGMKRTGSLCDVRAVLQGRARRAVVERLARNPESAIDSHGKFEVWQLWWGDSNRKGVETLHFFSCGCFNGLD